MSLFQVREYVSLSAGRSGYRLLLEWVRLDISAFGNFGGGANLRNLAVSEERGLIVLLKLLTKADRCICLHSVAYHICGGRQRLLILWKLFHEDLLCLFITDKLADFLSESLCLKFVTHLCYELERLTEVEHVHVVKDLLLLIGHDAESDGIHGLLVHRTLELHDLIVVHNRLTLGELVVVLGAEMLKCLPVLLAEHLVLELQPLRLDLGFDLRDGGGIGIRL